MDSKLVKQLDETQKAIEEVQGEIMQKTVDLQNRLATLKKQDANVREAIRKAMEDNDVKKFESENMSITYIAPTKRKGVDAAKLEQMHPKIYQKVLKYSDVKSSVRIKKK